MPFFSVVLDVRCRCVARVEADTPQGACEKAEQIDPWDLDVDVVDTTAESWEVDE